jgi:hypothetical protein
MHASNPDVTINIVACFLGNATSNLSLLDFITIYFDFLPGGATIIRYISSLTITVTLSQHSAE